VFKNDGGGMGDNRVGRTWGAGLQGGESGSFLLHDSHF
jgi:hypothetical protein